MKETSVAVVAAGAVTVAALVMGQDGPALTAFFGFLAGLGLARRPQVTQEEKTRMLEAVEALAKEKTGTAPQR